MPHITQLRAFIPSSDVCLSDIFQLILLASALLLLTFS